MNTPRVEREGVKIPDSLMRKQQFEESRTDLMQATAHWARLPTHKNRGLRSRAREKTDSCFKDFLLAVLYAQDVDDKPTYLKVAMVDDAEIRARFFSRVAPGYAFPALAEETLGDQIDDIFSSADGPADVKDEVLDIYKEHADTNQASLDEAVVSSLQGRTMSTLRGMGRKSLEFGMLTGAVVAGNVITNRIKSP